MNSSFLSSQSYVVQLSFGGDQVSEGCWKCTRDPLVNINHSDWYHNLQTLNIKVFALHCTDFNNYWRGEAWKLQNTACLFTCSTTLSRSSFIHVTLKENAQMNMVCNFNIDQQFTSCRFLKVKHSDPRFINMCFCVTKLCPIYNFTGLKFKILKTAILLIPMQNYLWTMHKTLFQMTLKGIQLAVGILLFSTEAWFTWLSGELHTGL